MSKTMCPGQDTRYWRPDDIFTVPCGSCGASIEFFKDEASRRCAGCGTRVQNPRLSMGCAQWCEHAKECLGYDPRLSGEDGTGAGQSVADIILSALRHECGDGSAFLEGARNALERARNHLKSNGANPGVVIPAVLLLMADRERPAERSSATTGGPPPLPLTEKILKEAGVSMNTADDVCRIIRSYHAGEIIDSPEFTAVRDAYSGSIQ